MTHLIEKLTLAYFSAMFPSPSEISWIQTIEMKGITTCKLTIISESAVCKKFLGQIWSYAASL